MNIHNNSNEEINRINKEKSVKKFCLHKINKVWYGLSTNLSVLIKPQSNDHWIVVQKMFNTEMKHDWWQMLYCFIMS